ncbi:MAG: Smr/MutS family protein [Rhizobacter sp.]|nr:Smr/MutS family protein [Rhizobacter sp.]
MKRPSSSRVPRAALAVGPAANGIAALGALRAELQRREREAAEREAAARAALERERDREREARTLFARSVGAVTPLADDERAWLRAAPPEPEPRQRERDEADALRATLSDEFDVESLLETDDALSFRRPDIGPDVVRKLRRGGWVIQAQIDLHGLRRDEARDRLAAFLREAARQGLRCVRVVHGKGNGSPGREPVLKQRVHAWLVQKSSVIAFTQARAAEGGSGALIVLLKPQVAVKGAR